jgi:transcriptional regulator with XRE-family HTH domain
MTRIGQARPIRWYLKEWRVHKGLTLERMAERLETNKGQVSKLERGEQRMNDSWLAGYAEALGIEPSQLLRDPEAPNLNDLLLKATPEQIEKIKTIVSVIIGSDAA